MNVEIQNVKRGGESVTKCKFDNGTILYYKKDGEWYHPSVVVSMKCPNPKPKEGEEGDCSG
jgi:hypothetical protein